MSAESAVKSVRDAAKRRERAIAARERATAELRDSSCRKAQAAGVSNSQIAREAGLSRQGVYDLLSARPSQ